MSVCLSVCMCVCVCAQVVIDLYIIKDSVHWAAENHHQTPTFDLKTYENEITSLVGTTQHVEFRKTEVLMEVSE